MMKHLIQYLFVLFIQFQSIRTDDCQFTAGDAIFDLRTLGNPKSPKYNNIPDADGSGTRVYSYNGCFKYSKNGNCQNAAACFTDVGAQVSTLIVPQMKPTFDYNAGLSQLVYSSGGSSLRMTLLCDDKDESIRAGKLTTGKEDYYIFITGLCACPGKCTYKEPSSISGGAVFIIILISIVGAYLLFGVLFLGLVKKQRGLDMLPNRNFWRQAISDSLNGVRFLLSKTGLVRDSYEKV